jgi:hypothetical protein
MRICSNFQEFLNLTRILLVECEVQKFQARRKIVDELCNSSRAVKKRMHPYFAHARY